MNTKIKKCMLKLFQGKKNTANKIVKNIFS